MYPFYTDQMSEGAMDKENWWQHAIYPTYDTQDIRHALGIDSHFYQELNQDHSAYYEQAALDAAGAHYYDQALNPDNSIHAHWADMALGEAGSYATQRGTNADIMFPNNPLPNLRIAEMSPTHLVLYVDFRGIAMRVQKDGKNDIKYFESSYRDYQTRRIPQRVKLTGGILENSLNKRA